MVYLSVSGDVVLRKTTDPKKEKQMWKIELEWDSHVRESAQAAATAPIPISFILISL